MIDDVDDNIEEIGLIEDVPEVNEEEEDEEVEDEEEDEDYEYEWMLSLYVKLRSQLILWCFNKCFIDINECGNMQNRFLDLKKSYSECLNARDSWMAKAISKVPLPPMQDFDSDYGRTIQQKLVVPVFLGINTY